MRCCQMFFVQLKPPVSGKVFSHLIRGLRPTSYVRPTGDAQLVAPNEEERMKVCVAGPRGWGPMCRGEPGVA